MNALAASNPELDRLFGLLTIQTGVASAPEVIAALQRVSAERTLADVMQADERISAEERRAIDLLVRRSIDRLGDPRRAIDSLGGDAILAPAPAPSEFASFGGDAPIASDDELGSTLQSDRTHVPVAGVEQPGAPLISLEAAGRYEFRREQGRGGQSRVHVAFDRDISREIAIKELLPERSGNPHAVARFIREARITGQLEHPNIVPVYELGRHEDGTYYCAQKLVRGRTFGDALRACRSLFDRLRLLPHFEGLCQAIAYAHSRGVVHRDIKPDNVMVGDFGETVVLDWGLAKARDQHEQREQTEQPLPNAPLGATVVGSAIGTPAYMSPEQALGDLPQIDEHSDVWSLGAMLFEILTGRTPFEGETAFEVIGKVIKAPIPSIRALAPEAPRELAAIAEKALTRDRALRYQNAAELAREIEKFRLGRRVDAYEYTSFELLRRFVAKNRVLTGIVLASLVLIGLAAGFAFRRDRESRRNLSRAFVEKAREAERTLSWGEAAVFRAAARTYDPAADLPESVVFDGAFEARPIARLQGHDAPIDFMAVSPNAPLLITGSRDGTVGFWDLARPGLIARQPAHPGSSDIVVALAPSGRTAASLGNGEKGTLTLWDPGARKPLWTVSAPSRQMALAVSPNDDLIATATENRLELWSAANRSVIRSWPVSDAPTALAFFDGGRALISGHANGALRVWDTADGHLQRTLAGHQQWISYLRTSRDQRWVTTSSYDRRAAVWDLATGEAIATFEGHEGPVLESAFSPDGKLLASVSFDGALRVWSIAARAQVARILVPGVPLIAVSFSPDGKSLIAAGGDQVIRMWAIPADFRDDSLQKDAQKLVHSGDGRFLAYAAPDQSIRVWDVARGGLTRRLPPSAQLVDAISLSADGSVLSARSPPELTVWDVRTGHSRLTLKDYPNQMLASTLSSDGTELSVGLANGAVLVWNVGDQKLIATLNRGSGTATALTFSPDHRLLAALYSDGGLVLWDVAAATARSFASLPSAGVEFLAFAPEGQILWQGADHVVHRFELATQRETARFIGNRAPLVALSSSPDGTRLITAGQDNTVRIWDAKTGGLIAALDHHWASISSIAAGPAPGGFTSGGSDGRLRRFRLVRLAAPKQQLAEVQEKFGLRLVGIELVDATVPNGPSPLIQ